MTTNSSPSCPQCGAAIPEASADGLCPRCVFAKAASPTGDGGSVPYMPPSLESVRTAFPHLEVIALIGSGGMGAVFKARQPQLDRFVALKILPTELAEQPGFSERFQREAQALAKLSHPHIVTIHDFGSVVQSSGLPSDESRGRNHLYCLLMEFVDGSRIRSSRFLAFICLGLIVSFQKPIFAVETIRLKSDRGAATVGACLPLGVGVLLK